MFIYAKLYCQASDAGGNMAKKRKLTQKQVAGMLRNRGLRTPPQILRQELGADDPLDAPKSIYDDEPDMFDDMLDEYSDFEDMDGDE